MTAKQSKNFLLLFTAAVIWGVAFVAQSVGMDYVGPYTFNMVRTLLGGLVLIPCIFLLGKKMPGRTAKRISRQKRWTVPVI